MLTSGLLPRVTGAPPPWAPTEERWTQEPSGTFPASRTHLKVVLGRDEEAGAFTHPPLPFIGWMLTHRHQSRTIFCWLIDCDDPSAPKKTTRRKKRATEAQCPCAERQATATADEFRNRPKYMELGKNRVCYKLLFSFTGD